MILWLDDIRDPAKYGYVGAVWCKTAEEAIDLLKTGKVTFASLDHDLSVQATLGMPKRGEKTGLTVVLWMEANQVWPKNGVRVHSVNPEGRAKMERVISRNNMCGHGGTGRRGGLKIR